MISTDETSERLLKHGISLYKISEILAEPKSTIQNMLNGHSKYAQRKVENILKRINSYLDELELKTGTDTKIRINPELSIKLLKLGLDSKSFTPEEKLQLALAHKKLTDSNNQNKNNHE